MILAMAGTAALSLVFPIAIAIAILLAIVTISYEQTIHAYPSGAARTSWPATTWGSSRRRSQARRC